MTYNVKCAGDAGDWELRRAPLLDIVRRNRPDVLCVQEARAAQIADLLAGLPGFAVIGEGREGGDTGEWTAILVRSADIAVVDGGSFWLSDTPGVPGSNTWGSQYVRMATWARLRRIGVDASPLTVVTTHFDHEPTPHGDEVRRRSAHCILRETKELGERVVLVGDCNEPAGRGAAWTALVDAGYRDAWQIAGAADDVDSFNDWSPPVHRGERIDWALVKGAVGVRSVHMDHADPSTWAASDHFPVVVDLAV